MTMTTLDTSPDALYAAAREAGMLPFTGRQIVMLQPGASVSEMAGALQALGPMAAASDFAGGFADLANLGGAATLLFDQLGVALLAPGAGPIGALALDAQALDAHAKADPAIAGIEPETFVFALDGPEAGTATWGLTATRVPRSAFTGLGIKVAVLDTGFDLAHPDFAGRAVTSASFVPGEPVADLHGHGTHCIGTSCGPLNPAGVPRYGIAHEASIFAGKVLSNSGTGTVGGILAGINWAIANGCHVVSMSLGGPGGPYAYYQQAAQRALAAGTLIVAAAGNDSRRPGYIAPAGAPANTPGIVSVAAVDAGLAVAFFSSSGKIEIAAPGVDIFSSLPVPRLHGTLSGTSMATPHVAGIAALLAQSDPALRGAALANALTGTALPLAPQPASDVGAGLVQAP
jgi:subtilisin family serine protease